MFRSSVYPYFVTPLEAIENELAQFGIKIIKTSTEVPGTIVIETDKVVSPFLLGRLEYIKPAGIDLIVKATSEKKTCLCFGPPVHYCPVHFVD
jgi:hypothetical protein